MSLEEEDEIYEITDTLGFFQIFHKEDPESIFNEFSIEELHKEYAILFPKLPGESFLLTSVDMIKKFELHMFDKLLLRMVDEGLLNMSFSDKENDFVFSLKEK